MYPGFAVHSPVSAHCWHCGCLFLQSSSSSSDAYDSSAFIFASCRRVHLNVTLAHASAVMHNAGSAHLLWCTLEWTRQRAEARTDGWTVVPVQRIIFTILARAASYDSSPSAVELRIAISAAVQTGQPAYFDVSVSVRQRKKQMPRIPMPTIV